MHSNRGKSHSGFERNTRAKGSGINLITRAIHRRFEMKDDASVSMLVNDRSAEPSSL